MKFGILKSVGIVATLLLIVFASKTYKASYMNMKPLYIEVKEIQKQQEFSTKEAVYKPSSGRMGKDNKIKIEEEAYDKEGIYFNGMEKVYPLMKYNEVESLKNKLLYHIRHQLGSKEKECSVRIIENSHEFLKFGLRIGERNLVAEILKARPLEVHIINK